MLFHTWPFFVFLLIVLPVFFALRKTRLWLPWLTVASYFFYGWWNPYYLILVVYSTLLDFCLVALMDHCPKAGQKVDVMARLTGLRFDDRVLKFAFIGSVFATIGIVLLAAAGLASGKLVPKTATEITARVQIKIWFRLQSRKGTFVVNTHRTLPTESRTAVSRLMHG